MPILDKLNTKLEEAGVEERGRTIEEAVDLLPAMGGGIKLEQIGTPHNVGWVGSGGGGIIKYYKMNDLLCAVEFIFGGSPTTITKNQKILLDEHPNIKHLLQTPSNTMIAVTNTGEYRVMTCTHESGKLWLINNSEECTITALYNTVLFLAQPADNIT